MHFPTNDPENGWFPSSESPFAGSHFQMQNQKELGLVC